MAYNSDWRQLFVCNFLKVMYRQLFFISFYIIWSLTNFFFILFNLILSSFNFLIILILI